LEATMNRREALGTLGVGGASLLTDINPGFAQATAGTAPVKIRDIKTIRTAPNRIRLVVVKVETTEPGLVGWGCATFTQRALVGRTAIAEFLNAILMRR